MTSDTITPNTEELCADLGMEGNPAVQCPIPSLLHRCYAGPVPAPIDAEHQTIFCLRGAYMECDRWRSASRIDARHDARAEGFTGSRGGLRWLSSRARPAIVGLVAMIAVALVGLALVQWVPLWTGSAAPGGGSATKPPATAAPPPLAAAPAPATTLASGAPSAVPSPSPVPPTATASASPTQAASPTALPTVTQTPKTHTIQSGDNLWTVATSNGLTVDELMRANGLVDRNSTLRVGQELVVPTPAPRP